MHKARRVGASSTVAAMSSGAGCLCTLPTKPEGLPCRQEALHSPAHAPSPALSVTRIACMPCAERVSLGRVTARDVYTFAHISGSLRLHEARAGCSRLFPALPPPIPPRPLSRLRPTMQGCSASAVHPFFWFCAILSSFPEAWLPCD